ncbi:uncharacterized protein LOC131219324 [Magnolia sinica]|uniref:uncharacterized protein LOC131219324 n=1 Tax=Magnolia sinica TaxID=86752 RepID=UPI0026583B64|nr:uncharacterized protein LOC131219324 [Magnolia sinica]XP_058070378.1 uncharacterized protein LOC131219324 [Magnolia sinica]XP_058070379.1 uncharacterized protein LOC131219324 [Magnolia sinica]XP_058070380.1 uncharacterized protein LOC131219324 [Magnolia sinica]
MPGNEVADKVHNFFEQDSLSQSQNHSQAASGNWSFLNNNQWIGNQRQNGAPVNSNSKHCDVQASDSERAQSWQASQIALGTDLTQLSLRPEFVKSQPRNQQLSLNGFMLGPQGFQTAPNQAEFLGDDTIPDRHNLMSRSAGIPESQQGNAPEHPPGFTRNSEQFETAEAPVNFDFLGGPQQLMRNQQLGVPQPRPRQQPGLNDMQTWQHHIMYKQLHEFQKQQQLQQLDQESRQHNSLSQLSAITKQSSGDQMPALVNGAPVHDASNYMWSGELMGGDSSVPSSSQMFMVGNMNWMQRSGSPAVQAFPNGLVLSQDQGQALRSMGIIPQQLDQSLYGAPISSTRGALNPYSHFQGISHDGAEMLTKGSGNQVEKPMLQSAAFGSFQSEQGAAFPNQVCTQDGASISKQGFQGKNLFGQVPIQTLNNGIMPGNFPQVNPLPRSMPVQEFQGRQEQPGWAGNLQERTATHVGTTQGLVNLNPTEEKILFSTDDGMMDASFGRSGGMSAGGYLHGNQLEGTDYINAFPSVQSGSWSALMQSAVAEASSNDTGLQDEWSGLSFQKTELSSGSHPTTINDTGKQPTWVDNNLQTASVTARPFPLFDDANMSPSSHSVPGLQQPTTKFAFDQSETARTDASHESLQHSPKEAGHWLDQNPQQKPVSEGSLQVQTSMHLENSSEVAWGSRMYEQSRRSAHSEDMELNAPNVQGSWAHQQRMLSYNISSQPCNKPNSRDINESVSRSGDATLKISHSENTTHHAQNNDGKRAMHLKRDDDSGMWKADDNLVNISLPNSAGGLGVKSGTASPRVNTEDRYMNNFSVLQNSSSAKINDDINQQALNSRQLEYGKHAFIDSSVNYRGQENAGNYHPQPGKGLQILESSMNNSGTYDKQQANSLQKEISSTSYVSGRSHPGQQTVGGDGMRETGWLGTSDSRPLVGANQKPAGQASRKTSGARRFQFHPMGNLGADVEPADTTKHVTHTQGPYQPIAQGTQSQEQGYFGEPKFVGHVVSNDDPTMEKGHLPDSQSNAKETEEVLSRGVNPGYGSAMSTSFDGSSNKGTVQTSQNMLELLHKVDQSKENDTATHFASSGHYSSGMPEAFASDASAARLQNNQSSASQGFGLRLAPPSQLLPISNHALSSQASSQTVNDLNSRHVDPEGNSSAADKSGLPAPAVQLPQQHISNQSNLSFMSKDDQKANSEPGSRLRQVCESQGEVEADQSSRASSRGAASRIPPFNLSAPSEAHVPAASMRDAGHSQPSYLKASGQQFLASQTPVTAGISQQGAFSTVMHNVWTNIPAQQRLSGGPSTKVPSNSFQPIYPSPRSLETTSWASQKADDQNMKKGGNGPFDLASSSVNSQQLPHGEEQPCKDSSLQERADQAQQTAGASQGQESMSKHLSDGNSVASSSPTVHSHQQELGRGKITQEPSQREHLSLQKTVASNQSIEAFGRTLKPSDFPHQNYSLLHQMQAMKGAETDPSRKGVKRPRADFGSDAEQTVAKTSQRSVYGYSKYVRDPAENELNAAPQRSFPSSDSKMLCFSSEGKDLNANSSSQLHVGDVPSQDMAMFGGNNQNHSSHTMHPGTISTPLRGAERPQINPQMAPSWFERYGTYKNGQIPGMSDGMDNSRRPAKAAAQQFFFGKASDSLHANTATEQETAVDASQVAGVWQSPANLAAANEHLSSPHSLPPVVLNQTLAVVRPKKRISVALELPWHKEVTEGSERLQNISMAELDWAQAANRRIEKVEDDSEMMEDGPSMPRPRIRLILTTQLMQQLLRSLPPEILRADATAEYDSVTYFAAKLALGDACSLISYSQSDSHVHPNNRNIITEKLKASESVEDQFLSKVVEDFIGRARKLEDDLLRMDKQASIVDIKVECQDLERFSIINRFARFHGRGSADGAESSSSSDAMARRPFPQRYVTAVAMPRNLPEGVPCLSL